MRRMTQKETTLHWLRHNGDLTFAQAVDVLHILDVRKRIQELRQDGYNIITITKKSPSGAKFGAYRLIQEAKSC